MRAVCGPMGALLVSAALLMTPTAATASAPAPVAASQAPSGWLALSMLTPSGAAVLGSTGVAAAQPPETSGPNGYRGPTPPIPVLVIWGATLAAIIYILTRHDHHRRRPNSPV